MASARVEITSNGFPIIEDVVKRAEKFVNVASFLFYDERVAELLIEKSRSGVSVELLTTPPTGGTTDNLKEWADRLHTRLSSSGVRIVICDWEVGQPQRTVSTFAGGRSPTWYAMHTKYLVTDRHALIMSADLTPSFSKGGVWDSFVVYDDPSKARLLLNKYVEMKEFFTNVERRIPIEYIDSTLRPRKLLKGYPYVETEPPTKDGFYNLPSDAYGRKVIEQTINCSDSYIYFVYETFFDDRLSSVIIRKLITTPRIDVKILSPPLSVYQQNPLKARANFVQLASHGAEIKNIPNLRAKMLITDSAVVSGSFDLTVMGMGRKRGEKRLKLWVESTEITDINKDRDFILDAKKSFLEIYEKASKQYGKWFEKDAESSLRSAGARTIAGEAKEILGLLIFNEGRKSNERIRRISLIAVEIAKLINKDRPYVKAVDVLNAEKILLLAERNELGSENVAAIIGTLDGSRFLKRLESII